LLIHRFTLLNLILGPSIQAKDSSCRKLLHRNFSILPSNVFKISGASLARGMQLEYADEVAHRAIGKEVSARVLFLVALF